MHSIAATILTGSIFDDWFLFTDESQIMNTEYARHFKFLVFILPNEIVLFSVIQQMAADSKHWYWCDCLRHFAYVFSYENT